MADQGTKTALVAGATGLVGSRLVELLCADPAWGRVVVLARRKHATAHPKLQALIVDFDHLTEAVLPPIDAAFCCLGTTIKRAGSEAAFRRVDHDYVLAFAERALAAGARQFLLVSALGADARSAVFYNRVKGEAEAAIGALGYASASIFRPSLLAGRRREFRFGERLTLALLRPVRALLPASIRPIEDVTVARAMLAVAHAQLPGVRIIPSGEMQRHR
ncbi:MAG: NAD-dependent epimerase/dehydratase family protein [Rhodocyclaceae bacterium]|nr:MAG: NAD-dependent epimerase/dehydratase family protein [Rhodocyclaceae bacterium]